MGPDPGPPTLVSPGGCAGDQRALDYYRGQHRLRFASPEFAEFFSKRFAGFTDNWCAPVVDSCAERLTPLGLRLGKDGRQADTEFQRVFDANNGAQGFTEAATMALAYGPVVCDGVGQS